MAGLQSILGVNMPGSLNDTGSQILLILLVALVHNTEKINSTDDLPNLINGGQRCPYFFSQFRRNMREIGNLGEFLCLSSGLMKGSGFSRYSDTKFKCNIAVIGVVHSGTKMKWSHFSEGRWDENCCNSNSLYKFKDYQKNHPLPQYAQVTNIILIIKCSSKWNCDGVWHSTHVTLENGATVFSNQTTSCLLLLEITRNLRYGSLWNQCRTTEFALENM